MRTFFPSVVRILALGVNLLWKYFPPAGLAAAFVLPGVGVAQTGTVDARCSENIYVALRRDLKIPLIWSPLEAYNILAESCTQWSHDPSLTLAAIAFDADAPEQKRIVAAIIDRSTMLVVSSYDLVSHDGSTKEEREQWGGYGELQIDTARYQLANNVGAFALRFERRQDNWSCANLRSGSELTLLAAAGRNLRPVLALYMQQERALEGCLGTGRTFGTIAQSADLTIGVEKTSTNAFQDLTVTARITKTNYDVASQPVSSESVERRKLRYDGRTYQLDGAQPWWLEFLP